LASFDKAENDKEIKEEGDSGAIFVADLVRFPNAG